MSRNSKTNETNYMLVNPELKFRAQVEWTAECWNYVNDVMQVPTEDWAWIRTNSFGYNSIAEIAFRDQAILNWFLLSRPKPLSGRYFRIIKSR